METESTQAAIEALLDEQRTFPPPEEFAAQAVVADDSVYRRADEDPEAFWRGLADEFIDWFKEPTKGLEWDPPHCTWFADGELNVAWNCLDRHVEAGRGDRVAYHWVGEPEGESADLTYAEMLREVSRLANALRKLGVSKGDRVGIYMGMVPELPIAMLACARIGAPHVVVFGGFSSESLAERLRDSGAKLLITQDEGWRKGGKVPLKENADAAADAATSVERLVVFRRTGDEVPWNDERDLWWHDVVDSRGRRVRARAHGGRGHALPPPHLGDDREAEGRPARERRIPPPRRRHPQVDLRHPRRHDLVVCGRRRLGHRPQLHRLRAARERDDECPLRGRPRLPGLGPPLGDRRALQGQLVLHRADPHPLVREDGRRLPGAARPLVAPPPRHRRGADQPGGLGLVLEGDRPGALPGRGYVVADGDRRHPHHTAPRPDHAQAGLGDGAVPGDQARDPGRAGRPRSAGPGRVPDREAPVARDVPDALGRRRALRLQLLLQVRPGDVLHGRRREAGLRRLLLAHGPDRRRHQRRRPPALDDRDRVHARRARGSRRSRHLRRLRPRPWSVASSASFSSRRATSRPTTSPRSYGSSSRRRSARSPGPPRCSSATTSRRPARGRSCAAS